MPATISVASDVHVLKAGLAMGEAPRWHDGRLWVCDWAARELLAIGADGGSEVVHKVDSFPFSVDWLPDGRLLVLSSGDRRVRRREPDGSWSVHAELSRLSEKPWNEIVVDRRGNAYVNNIGFDFPGGDFAPGIIALVAPNGAVRQVADGVAFPNGMAITPDNSRLILAESYGKKLTVFDIAPDGSLENRRVWAELDAYPDGICLDSEAAAWVAEVPGQRCMRVREGGEVLQTVVLDRGCFSCALGGDDGRTLFMVANAWGGPEAMGNGRTGQVVTTQAPAPAAGWPGA